MRRILLATTTLAMMTGLAVAQGSQTADPQNKAANPAATQSGTQQSNMQQNGATNAQSQAGPAAQQGAQAGIRQVDAAALKMTFYAVHAADMRASKLIGSEVYNLNNEQIGEVEDLILDNGKNVKAVVVSVGGFLGIGDRNVAVQPGSVVLSEQNDGSAKLVINTTRDDLKNAPAFNFADVDKAGTGTGTTGSGDGQAGRSAQPMGSGTGTDSTRK
jgi:sporulation protein YlmC with PRC-barrel domain